MCFLCNFMFLSKEEKREQRRLRRIRNQRIALAGLFGSVLVIIAVIVGGIFLVNKQSEVKMQQEMEEQLAEMEAEEEIAEDYKIDKDYVFINIAEYPRFDEMKTQVNVDGKLYPLTEISNIIGALSKARFNIPDVSVYVDESEKSKFEKFKLENYLDLPEIDREKFHGIHYDQIKLF